MRLLFNSDADAGLPPAAKRAVTGETDLDKLTPPTGATPTPAPAPASSAPPKPVVKDEKTLDIEICEHEDKLRHLRELKRAGQSASVPATKAVRPISTLPFFRS